MKLTVTSHISDKDHLILIGQKGSRYEDYITSKQELEYLHSRIRDNQNEIFINQYKRHVYICHAKYRKKLNLLEQIRDSGKNLQSLINKSRIEQISLIDLTGREEYVKALAEGLFLSNYRFVKYKKKEKEKPAWLDEIRILETSLPAGEVSELQHLLTGVYLTRDMVNEPLSYLTAVQLSRDIERLGEEAGFEVEVFHGKKIESLRMGGLLAVNRGSPDPPTFSILKWNPDNARNSKPVVLVGKGVVYDTGGLSLKPTHDSMDYMKSDMAGAAAVVGVFYAAARNRLPVNMIGLIPATDNRPDGNAYVPGDVIRMYDGTTVEVLNTDAEGRMILADALSWARKYKPGLVINLATLTGSAQLTFGKYCMAGMGNAGKEVFSQLSDCGERVFERVAVLPFWEDYKELLKSDIADLKNIGGRFAGAISAGKFLEHFTDYPFIHLDIAGPSFNKTEDSYRGKGGSGVCVRLIYEFLKKSIK